MKTKLLFTALLSLGVATVFISCNGDSYKSDTPGAPVDPKDTTTLPKDTIDTNNPKDTTTTGSPNDTTTSNNGTLNPNAYLMVNSVKSLSTHINSNSRGLGGSDITDSIRYIMQYGWEMHLSKGWRTFLGSTNQFRDFENNRFKFWGNKVVSSTGRLGDYFTEELDDIVFVVGFTKDSVAIDPIKLFSTPPADRGEYPSYYDTVAYIPNKIVHKAIVDVQNAFAEKDFETCYKLFDRAYVFIPITGPKWRALKEAGIE